VKQVKEKYSKETQILLSNTSRRKDYSRLPSSTIDWCTRFKTCLIRLSSLASFVCQAWEEVKYSKKCTWWELSRKVFSHKHTRDPPLHITFCLPIANFINSTLERSRIQQCLPNFTPPFFLTWRKIPENKIDCCHESFSRIQLNYHFPWFLGMFIDHEWSISWWSQVSGKLDKELSISKHSIKLLSSSIYHHIVTILSNIPLI
jgi:hypothetical protein